MIQQLTHLLQEFHLRFLRDAQRPIHIGIPPEEQASPLQALQQKNEQPPLSRHFYVDPHQSIACAANRTKRYRNTEK